jgi:uncharacterized membrane protein
MNSTEHDERRRIFTGLAIAGIGLAHFAFPGYFDPINAMAFPARPRQYTYINGGIETAMGLMLMSPAPRIFFRALSVGYVCYLLGNLVRARPRGAPHGVVGAVGRTRARSWLMNG